MSGHQIFISYARKDRDAAERLSEALERDGWSVWWDRKLVAGTSFDEVIDAALAKASCIIVLWSRTSVKSGWVKNEAAEGLKRKILVPVLLENVQMPLQFRHLHAVDLTAWPGEATHVGYRSLAQAVGDLTADAVDESLADSISDGVGPRRPNAHRFAKAVPIAYSRRSVLATAGGLAVAAAGGLAWNYTTRTPSTRIPETEIEQLRNACRRLSRKLAARQESTGDFKDDPYRTVTSAHVTAQVLYGLFVSAHSGSGEIGLEPSARGAQAICRFMKGLGQRQETDAATSDAAPGPDAEQPEAPVTVAWSVMALSRYLAMNDAPEVRQALLRCQSFLLSSGLENGAFSSAPNPLTTKRPNAYATVLGLMALVESRRTLGADEATDRRIVTSARWLAETFPAPSRSAELALQAVNGLAAQAFWAVEQAREVHGGRRRTSVENRMATLLLHDLRKQCRKSASPEKACTAPDGRIPSGRDDDSPLIMLWLPWSTLAALELAREPPSGAKEDEVEEIGSIARDLVATLTARGDLNVDNYRYEPAEMLMAMGEALRLLGVSPTS